jgi:alpha-glucosidase (family GH31 glycosyl hydrolase)
VPLQPTGVAPLEMDVAGAARFTAVSPTLVRLEYAGDGRFEDRPSFNVINRNPTSAPLTETTVDGWRIACTARLCIHYRQGSGPFAAQNLYLEFKDDSGKDIKAVPQWGQDSVGQNLGGWTRALDNVASPQPLHDGLISRDGWYLVDDSDTALWDDRGLVASPPHGAYQSGYFFAYGHDYKQALAELAQLTGAIPLLPRWAFGVWYSRYYAYSQSDYVNDLVPRFRKERVPLDVLVVDTDWKAPFDWNGWTWNRLLFPDPAGFFDWARREGLNVTLNIHPSLKRGDPQFAYLDLLGKGLLSFKPDLYVWDWGNPRHVESYFTAHQPLEDLGVRFWWLDWCCEPAGDTLAGTTPDTLINALYATRATARGQRGFAFSRIGSFFAGYGDDRETTRAGAWAEHRYTIHFTGDTHPSWAMLQYAATYTIREGNLLLSHVSHDIGSFHAKHLDDELYVRWLQLGTFQPILRLHSDHGDRLPWQYGAAARQAGAELLRLRQRLSAYIYTAARQAHDHALPLVRGLYLEYPNQLEAYRYQTEYLFGDALLVAPVVTAAPQPTELWLPPGSWYHFFSEQRYVGNTILRVSSSWEELPLFVPAGAIIPLVPDDERVGEAPPAAIAWHVYPGAKGQFTLYDDAGEGLGYLANDYAFTTVQYEDKPQAKLTIGAPTGSFKDNLVKRVHTVVFHDVSLPSLVKVDSQRTTEWRYDPHARQLTVWLSVIADARARVVELR